jgi:hypothetical protein
MSTRWRRMESFYMPQKFESQACAFVAFSIKPGMSATTKLFLPSGFHYAQNRGKGSERIIGDFRFAADMREMRVDLPAFGKPTRPTSAAV